MRIGLDFDNTLVSYDGLFLSAAGDRGWIAPADAKSGAGGKNLVRRLVRQLPEGEEKWQTLQAEVYGPRMHEAILMPGAARFMREAARQKAEMFIVSHKTRYALRDFDRRTDLRLTALNWMDQMVFFATDGFGLLRKNVFFNETRQKKVARIAELACDHFIDDLPEVFMEPGFPAATNRILISPGADVDPDGPYRTNSSWDSIRVELLGSDA